MDKTMESPFLNIKEQKINDVKVEPPKIKRKEKLKVKGAELFDEPYPNIGIFTMKKGGKTVLAYNIMDKCSDQDTDFYIYAPTFEKDETLKALVDKNNKNIKDIDYSLVDDDGGHAIDRFIEEYKDEVNSDLDDDEQEKIVYGRIFPKTEKKKKKKKYLYPKRIVFCDDLGDECRDKKLGRLMRKNRHYRTMTITSIQDVKDMAPAGLKQLDYALLLGNISDDRLKDIHKTLALNISLDKFIELYKKATSELYNFLYIDRRNHEFRQNFNNKLTII